MVLEAGGEIEFAVHFGVALFGDGDFVEAARTEHEPPVSVAVRAGFASRRTNRRLGEGASIVGVEYPSVDVGLLFDRNCFVAERHVLRGPVAGVDFGWGDGGFELGFRDFGGDGVVLVDFYGLLESWALFFEVFGGHDGLAVEDGEGSLFDVDGAVEGYGLCCRFAVEADEFDGAEEGDLGGE